MLAFAAEPKHLSSGWTAPHFDYVIQGSTKARRWPTCSGSNVLHCGLLVPIRRDSGYDKRTVAEDVNQLVDQLELGAINLVSHGVGMMVAYAYAFAYPSKVKRVVLMEAALPGLGWKSCMTPRNIHGCIICPSLKRQTGWQKPD